MRPCLRIYVMQLLRQLSSQLRVKINTFVINLEEFSLHESEVFFLEDWSISCNLISHNSLIIIFIIFICTIFLKTHDHFLVKVLCRKFSLSDSQNYGIFSSVVDARISSEYLTKFYGCILFYLFTYYIWDN